MAVFVKIPFETMPTVSAAAAALGRLLQDADTADVLLVCGGQEWRLHSTILGVRSPFFRAMMLNDMKEKKEKRFEVKEMEPENIKQVINYMYGITIKFGKKSMVAYNKEEKDEPQKKKKKSEVFAEDDNEKGATIHGLLEAADRFQMDDMKDEVGRRIGEEAVNRNNALKLGELAETFNNTVLLKECAKHIARTSAIKIGSEEIEKMPKLVLEILNVARGLTDCY